MTYEEMKAYIANMVKSQGSQGAIEIAPLLYAMADKMFADPETGVVPIVISIAEVGNNQFTVQIGTVSAQLTPGQMMLTTEEYNKVSNDADYTAMWAYAIAEYICCPPWFEGFAGFKLHSAFYKAEKTIFIDLNAVELSVVTLASAFYGCSRLEQITGILKIASNVPLTDAFKGCAVLHTVKLSGLSSNIDLSDCAQLSVETIEHLIEKTYITIQSATA